MNWDDICHEVFPPGTYSSRPKEEERGYPEKRGGSADLQPRACVLNLVEESESHSYEAGSAAV